MKNFFWTLLMIAIVMTLCADKIKALWSGHSKWRTDLAVQQVVEAKSKYAQAYADRPNALASFDAATPEERISMLEDEGLMNEKTSLFVADPGSLDEAPTPHTPQQMEAVSHEARGSLGAALASL